MLLHESLATAISSSPPPAPGPMDYAKEPKLRFRVGDLDLPEKRKRYTSSREEDVATNMCPFLRVGLI